MSLKRFKHTKLFCFKAFQSVTPHLKVLISFYLFLSIMFFKRKLIPVKYECNYEIRVSGVTTIWTKKNQHKLTDIKWKFYFQHNFKIKLLLFIYVCKKYVEYQYSLLPELHSLCIIMSKSLERVMLETVLLNFYIYIKKKKQ